MRLKRQHGGAYQGSHVLPSLFAHAVWLDLGFCCVSLGDQDKSSTLGKQLCRLIYEGLPLGGPHECWSFSTLLHIHHKAAGVVVFYTEYCSMNSLTKYFLPVISYIQLIDWLIDWLNLFLDWWTEHSYSAHIHSVELECFRYDKDHLLSLLWWLFGK
jgi:hypothetical protein